MNIRTVSLTLNVLALFTLGTMGVSAYQTHAESRFDAMESQHATIMINQATQEERIRSIDAQLQEIKTAHLAERMERIESTNDTNTRLLIGIMIPLLLLVIERILVRVKEKTI